MAWKTPSRPRPPQFWGFRVIHRHTTIARTPLGEWSARSRELYLTTHNIRKRSVTMHPAGFKPWIPESDRQQNHVLDRASNWIGSPESFLLPWRNSRSGPRAPHYRWFVITLSHSTVGRTLDEWSARRRDLYMTTHNTHKRQTLMPPEVFEPKIPASRPTT